MVDAMQCNIVGDSSSGQWILHCANEMGEIFCWDLRQRIAKGFLSLGGNAVRWSNTDGLRKMLTHFFLLRDSTTIDW